MAKDEHGKEEVQDSEPAPPVVFLGPIALIVEDSPPNLQILIHAVKRLGFEVLTASNGSDAWEILSGKDAPKVTIIISDIIMPKMDGLELLRRVREEKALSSLPMVIVSALADRECIVRAKALNVSAYLIKPLRFEVISKTIEKALPNR